MVDEWKDCLLGDVIELKRGYDLPRKKRLPGDVPLISSSGVTDSHALAMVKGPGVVTGRYGTLGQVFYVEQDFWPLNTTLYVRDFKGNDPRFISYFLRGVDFSAYSDKAAVPGLNRNHLHQAKVRLPTDLTEQRAIAHILGSLDDKIELNRRMNETLEAMASALFKSWFVDFDPVMDNALAAGNPIPEELLDRAALRESLGDARKPLPDNLRDLFPDDFALTEEMGWIPKGWKIGLEHMPMGSISLGNWGFAEDISSGKSWFAENDILFGKLRPYFHKVGVAPVDGVCSTDIVVITPKIDEWFSIALCIASSKTFVEYTTAGSTGTKMPRTNWKYMAAYKVCLSAKSVADIFDSLLKPSIAKILANLHANRDLSRTRNTLLPKLLSGEIRIPEAEKLVEAAG
jgi:type I restriction enzyme S subunit